MDSSKLAPYLVCDNHPVDIKVTDIIVLQVTWQLSVMLGACSDTLSAYPGLFDTRIPFIESMLNELGLFIGISILEELLYDIVNVLLKTDIT